MFAKFVIIPLFAILLTACGGGSSPDPKAEAQAVAQRAWDSQSTGSRAASCMMYKSNPTALKKTLEMNVVYKDKSLEERQMFVDAVFAILDKEC